MIKLASLMFVSTLLSFGCGDDGSSLVGICEEAQSRDCTFIKGNCGDFVAAINDVADNAGCQPQLDAYEDCASGQDACSVDNACGSQETAFTTCGAPYCLTNASDPSCVTIANGF